MGGGFLAVRFTTLAFEGAAGCGGELQDAPAQGRGCIQLLECQGDKGACVGIGRVRQMRN